MTKNVQMHLKSMVEPIMCVYKQGFYANWQVIEEKNLVLISFGQLHQVIFFFYAYDNLRFLFLDDRSRIWFWYASRIKMFCVYRDAFLLTAVEL